MPEIKNEIPNLEELHKYLMEHFNDSIFGLAFINEDPAISIKILEEPFDSFIELGFYNFFNKVAESIFNGLKRLNGLPRSDSFWLNTNNRPTIYKLKDFCKMELERNPNDVAATWTRISLNVYWGSLEFDKQKWKLLYVKDSIDLSWPIFYALYNHYYTGLPTCGLDDFIFEINCADKAITIFKKFIECEDKVIKEWAQQMLLSITIK